MGWKKSIKKNPVCKRGGNILFIGRVMTSHVPTVILKAIIIIIIIISFHKTIILSGELCIKSV